jgi:glycosyltransferase involved in cell wall biosynthesis
MKKKKFYITTTIPDTLGFFKGNLSFLNESFFVKAISSDKTKMKAIAQREGIAVHHIPMKRDISLFNDILGLLRFVILFIKEKPDIVHGNTPKAGLLSMLASKVVGIKVRIYMCHGLRYQGFSGKKKKLLMLMEKLTCFCAHEVICVSNGVRDALINDGLCDKSKAIVVHHGSAAGIDLNKFDPEIRDVDRNKVRNDLNISDNDFVFIVIGRIVGDKGVNELFSAFDKLLTLNKKSHLIIVGSEDKGLDPISDRSSQIINNNKNIHSVGRQNDIRPFLKASDALVLPSYREGLATVLIEAGAMSLPCITTDVTGCNEIIIDNENGVIIPPKDENKLHEAMQYFLDNPEDVERMANNSRKMVIDRYEQQVVWDALLEEYRRLEKELIKS